MLHIFSLASESCQICSWHARRNAIFLRQMHLFVNNMADPDIFDYEFDADDLCTACFFLSSVYIYVNLYRLTEWQLVVQL
jgi:hypothetical protein